MKKETKQLNTYEDLLVSHYRYYLETLEFIITGLSSTNLFHFCILADTHIYNIGCCPFCAYNECVIDRHLPIPLRLKYRLMTIPTNLMPISPAPIHRHWWNQYQPASLVILPPFPWTSHRREGGVTTLTLPFQAYYYVEIQFTCYFTTSYLWWSVFIYLSTHWNISMRYCKQGRQLIVRTRRRRGSWWLCPAHKLLN